MEHGDGLPEIGGKGFEHLGGQRDLRHEQNRRAAGGQLCGDETDINRGLSAAGDALEQRALRLAAPAEGVQALKNRLLLRAQLRQRAALLAAAVLRAAEGLALKALQNSRVAERFERLTACAREGADVRRGALADGREQSQHSGLHFGAAGLLTGELRRLLRRNGEADAVRLLVADAAAAVAAEPESRGEHGAHGLVNRAEKALPHPEGKVDLVCGQDRGRVLHGGDLLHSGKPAMIGKAQHHALGAAVAARKGHDDAHSRCNGAGERGRHAVIIGPVHPVGDVGDCDLCKLLCHDFCRGPPFSAGIGSESRLFIPLPAAPARQEFPLRAWRRG